MKKLLLTTALCIGLSFNANARDFVSPMKNKDISSFTKWELVAGSFKEHGKGGKVSDLFEITQKTKDFKYIPDPKDFDIWQSPKITEALRGGDCEDFAIYWYNEALERGFKIDQLRIVVGYLPKQNSEAHTILAVEIDGQEYILDSYYGGTVKKIEEYKESDFKVHYFINNNGWGTE